MTEKQKDRLIDALNRIDELACISAESNDISEAEQLEKDYNLLFDYLNNIT